MASQQSLLGNWYEPRNNMIHLLEAAIKQHLIDSPPFSRNKLDSF
jgi:hypothetical protein